MFFSLYLKKIIILRPVALPRYSITFFKNSWNVVNFAVNFAANKQLSSSPGQSYIWQPNFQIIPNQLDGVQIRWLSKSWSVVNVIILEENERIQLRYAEALIFLKIFKEFLKKLLSSVPWKSYGSLNNYFLFIFMNKYGMVFFNNNNLVTNFKRKDAQWSLFV